MSILASHTILTWPYHATTIFYFVIVTIIHYMMFDAVVKLNDIAELHSYRTLVHMIARPLLAAPLHPTEWWKEKSNETQARRDRYCTSFNGSV